MIKVLDFLALILYCGFLYWLSDKPSLGLPMWFPHQDKVQHFSAYFILALIAWRNTFCWSNLSRLRRAILVILFCSVYGITDEWHQSFVVGRSSDMLDWLADTAGATLASVLLMRFSTQWQLPKRLVWQR